MSVSGNTRNVDHDSDSDHGHDNSHFCNTKYRNYSNLHCLNHVLEYPMGACYRDGTAYDKPIIDFRSFERNYNESAVSVTTTASMFGSAMTGVLNPVMVDSVIVPDKGNIDPSAPQVFCSCSWQIGPCSPSPGLGVDLL